MKNITLPCLFLILLVCYQSGTVSANFTIAVLPDTQGYSEKYPEIFEAQAKWIAKNVEEKNIVFVVHLGDIVNQQINETQWARADKALSYLDGKVPYILSVGNHDMGSTKEDAGDRNTDLYNKYFPYSRYEKESWYGGRMGEDNDNYYVFFSQEGMDFMIISLEFGPDEEIINWADRIISSNHDKRVILVTHAYLYSDVERLGKDHQLNPRRYGVRKLKPSPLTGEEIWEKLVKKNDNIFLVLSGHVFYQYRASKASIGEGGNIVHQTVSNYANMPHEGDGYLEIYEFYPYKNQIKISSHSPWLNRPKIQLAYDRLMFRISVLEYRFIETIREYKFKINGYFSKAYFEDEFIKSEIPVENEYSAGSDFYIEKTIFYKMLGN